MRFTLSTVLFFCCFTLVQAQLSKDTRFLSTSARGAGNLFYTTPLAVYGGLAEVSAVFGSGDGLLAVSATPQVGYFLSDHTLLGGTGVLTFFTDFDDSNTKRFC